MSRRSTPRLDARLAAVAELVPESARVADVGADHGRLALALLASGRVASCLATEATPARLARLAASVARHPLGSRLELRGGWGLGPLRIEDRLDCLVLAGMGGLKIAGILAGGGPRRAGGVGATVPGNRSPGEVDRLGVARLVLQPATEAAGLRRWLHANRLRLLDERLAFLHGMIGHALERDQEDIQDARASAFMQIFNTMLTGKQPRPSQAMGRNEPTQEQA